MRRFKFYSCGNLNVSYEEELAIFNSDIRRLFLIIAILLFFAVIPFACNRYVLGVLNTIGIFSIAAIGLNTLMGYTGQISLGHGAIFGFGSYTATILAARAGLPFWTTIPAAGIIAGFAGMLFCMPYIRLKKIYLLIATLAGQIIFEFLSVNWKNITGRSDGLFIIRTDASIMDLSDIRSLYYVVFLLTALMTLVAVNLRRTSFGRAFIAIREDRLSAEVSGIPVSKYKLMAFTISSFYAGIAGGLFAYKNLNSSFNPGFFNLTLSILFIAIIIVGGSGRNTGPIFGSILFVITDEILIHIVKALSSTWTYLDFTITITSFREFVFGLFIVLFILFNPGGLAELWIKFKSNFSSWPFPR